MIRKGKKYKVFLEKMFYFADKVENLGNDVFKNYLVKK